MALCDGAVHLFVCLSLKRVHKNAIFSKTKQLWSLLTSNRNYHNKLSKNPFWTPKIQNGGRPPYWKLFSAINQQPIVRFQWNFAWRSSFSQKSGNRTKTGVPQKVFFLFSLCILGKTTIWIPWRPLWHEPKQISRYATGWVMRQSSSCCRTGNLARTG